MMSEPAATWAAIAGTDQWLASVAQIAQGAATHYRTLRDAGVPDPLAGKLTRDWHESQLAMVRWCVAQQHGGA